MAAMPSAVAATIVAAVTVAALHWMQKEGNVVATKAVIAAAPASMEAATLTPSIGVEKKAGTLTHWHYHVSKSSQSELTQIFEDMGLTVLNGSESNFVLDVPKEKLIKFTNRIAEISGAVKEYGEIATSKENTDPVEVSIYME
jgi:hypothetical protein